MKKILGLDLGVASIGWALINVNDNNEPKEILGMGSRIVPLTTNDANEFSTGNAITKNQSRTTNRTQRKGYDRYQLRRKNLTDFLRIYNMLPSEELIKLNIIDLWSLRAKAVNNQITLFEFGRVLYHLNQKRGYKSAKSDEGDDKKQKDYVAEVNSRNAKIKKLDKTIGQYFFDEIKKSAVKSEKGIFYTYRTKEQVFPRIAYTEEFEKIWDCQAIYYPNILTAKNKDIVCNQIIYYQRGLKSCKHLVSLCEFELKPYLNKEGKTVYDGPKVAPKSSPIFQVCKIWESINNLILKNKKGEELYITIEQKNELFKHLDNNERLTITDLYKILSINKADGWWGGKAIGKGLQGNTTKIQLRKALVDFENGYQLLQFNLKKIDTKLIDTETGEITQQISTEFEKEPLYQLWHSIYSIDNKIEFTNAIEKNFRITTPETIDALFKIDFVRSGFGNKSAKSIRKILPYLQVGLKYSEACEAAGFKHSKSLTVSENNARQLLEHLPQIKKNELNQPVVEKILNQMINLVNAVIDKYGNIGEIRVELARDLKQSKDERNETSSRITANEIINSELAKKLLESNIPPTKRNIDKYKLIAPIRNAIKWDGKVDVPKLRNSIVCNQCIYCGKSFSLTSAMNGEECDIDHIIPKSLLFDDSQTNKVLVHKKCNQKDKNNKTAFDFIRDKGQEEMSSYLNRLDDWNERGIISNAKRDRLLASHENYLERKSKGNETDSDIFLWENFISRQLKETQYISRKAMDILSNVSRNVWATSGIVTSELRHIWGWGDVLMNLQLPKYKELTGLTEIIEWESENGKRKHKKEVIKNWSKRSDHRHHAVDALTVACTRQGLIQRINTLNSDSVKEEMKIGIKDVGIKFDDRKNLLQKYIYSLKPFDTKEVESAVEKILISFKAGKKAASIGKRIKYVKGKKVILQEGIIIPRGSLHEEGVYGRIYRYEKNKLSENVQLKPEIVKKYKMGVGAQGFLFTGKETYEEKIKTNKQTGLSETFIENKIEKTLNSIVDNQIRKVILERLNRGFEAGQSYKQDVKKSLNNLKNLESDPIYLDIRKTLKINTVRCFTGLSAIVPIKYNDKNEPISFVKPGNNHHIAIYTDKEGNKCEHVVTFWHAVERKKNRIPLIITNPEEVWNKLEDNKFSESFLNNLPFVDWKIDLSIQQNEMFILGMDEVSYKDALLSNDKATLSKYLYCVQNISEKQYRFSNHLETKFDISNMNKSDKRFYNIRSIDALFLLNPHKVKIDYLGNIFSL